MVEYTARGSQDQVTPEELQCLDLIVKNGANINQINWMKRNVLHITCHHKNYYVLAYLLNNYLVDPYVLDWK